MSRRSQVSDPVLDQASATRQLPSLRRHRVQFTELALPKFLNTATTLAESWSISSMKFRPEIAVPTHGERRHLLEHQALAKDLQVPQTVAPRNGDMVRLAPGHAQIIDQVPAGRLYIDAGMVTPENGEALRERRHAASNGVLHISLVLDGKGKLVAGPQLAAVGLPGDDDYGLPEALEDLTEEARAAVASMDRAGRDDDDAVRTLVSRKVKKACQRIWDRRPIVETVVLRV